MGFDKQADALITHYAEQGKAQVDGYRKQVFAEVAAAKQELADLKKQMETALAASQAQLASLSEEISQAQQTYQDLSAKITERHQELEQLRVDFATAGTKLNELHTAAAQQKQHMQDDFEAQGKILEASIREKNEHLQKLIEEVEGLSTTIATKQAEIEQITAKQTALVNDYQEAEIEFANLSENIVTAKEDLAAIQTQGVVVREELALMEKTLQDKQAQIADLDTQMVSVRQEQQKLEKDRAANTTMSKLLMEREIDLRIREKALAVRRLEVAKKEQEIKAAQAALADL